MNFGLINVETVQVFTFCSLCMGALVLCQNLRSRSTLAVWNGTSSEHSHVASLFNNEEYGEQSSVRRTLKLFQRPVKLLRDGTERIWAFPAHKYHLELK